MSIILAERVLALLLSFPPCWAERDDPERVVHLAIEARAIANVSRSVDDAAGLTSVLNAESAGCWSVATGLKHGGAGYGPFQLEAGSRRSPPFVGDNEVDLTHAAGEALWLWRHSWRCGHEPAARFRAFAGLPCKSTWPGAGKRARVYRYAVWQLSKEYS